ncbi:sensor histidine kinase [Cohnella hashimotonis]|uniref:histidine kinase n=1 Tax=Cohnella hashimotonis TaxID=2826895 RepID=A0ABT6TCL0_9BACL|nr:ATP-binding protein [Cohnella hashimotonis]MDI4644568.1 ATP-binding protein [Cohnella hashimotonis]
MQDLASFARQDLLISIPQSFTLLWLSFAVLGLRPAGRWRRIFALAALQSIYTDLLFPVLTMPVHMLNSIAATTLLLFVLFRNIGAKKKLMIVLLSYVISALSDLTVLYLQGVIYGNTEGFSAKENFLEFIVCLYPALFVQWTIAAAVGPLAVRWYAGLRAAGGYIRRNGLVRVLVCLLLQLLAGTTALLFRVAPGANAHYAVFDCLFYATVLLTLPTIFYVVRLIDRTQKDTVLSTQEHYIEQISGMFTSIRGQRHDFLNHIQVMHTMLKLGKIQELKAFMSDIVKETHEVGDIVHHDIPAVAALLQAKTAVALGLGIDFSSEFAGRWNPQSPVKVIDIVKIAGNLIDNAFDEVVKMPPSERRVRAGFRLYDGYLELTVSNPGPPISEAARARLFEPGFSTKPGSNRGLGLPIVRERVAHYAGTLTVHSDEKRGTVFQVRLPQKAAQLS